MKWPNVSLEKIAQITMGQSPPGSTYNETGQGLPFFQGKAEFEDKYPVVKKWCSSPTRLAFQNDILLSVRAPVGPTNLAPCKCCIGRGLAAIRSFENLLNQDYLWFFLKKFESQLSRQGQGAIFSAINKKEIYNLKVPLPPPSEQLRILGILDQADRLRKLRAEADKKAERILPALFIKMFGDPATNPMGWPTKPLSKVCIEKPQYGANASAAEWTEGKPRYVRITDIQENGQLSPDGIVTLNLDNWEPYRLIEGDVLFARSGNTVGKTYLYQADDGLCAYAGYLIRFKPDINQIIPLYLFALTHTEYYKSWVEARKRVAGQPNINGQEYSSFSVLCPPVPLQQKFSSLLNHLNNNRKNRYECHARLETLFNSLLHRAFTGDLTVSWRQAHMKELLQEMELQAKALNN